MQKPERVLVVIPVLDDWLSVDTLCHSLDSVFRSLPEYEVHIMLVDDGSSTAAALVSPRQVSAIRSIQILHLKRNVGHQRAIAIGLSYVQENLQSQYIVVMDGDGEDRPDHAPQLLQTLASSGRSVVFAERRRRFATLSFRVSYAAYRMVHRVLTGRSIRYGNFSAMRSDALSRLTVMSELWTHYAAAVVISRLPFTTVQLDRGSRYTGKTRMNMDSLVLHGMAAIALYPSVIVRVLLASSAVGSAAMAIAIAVAVRGIAINHEIAGWTASIIGLSVTLFSLTTLLSLVFVFTNLALRSLSTHIPIRDYHYFVQNYECVNDVEVSRK